MSRGDEREWKNMSLGRRRFYDEGQYFPKDKGGRGIASALLQGRPMEVRQHNMTGQGGGGERWVEAKCNVLWEVLLFTLMLSPQLGVNRCVIGHIASSPPLRLLGLLLGLLHYLGSGLDPLGLGVQPRAPDGDGGAQRVEGGHGVLSSREE